jgi:hypothetical protein
MSCVKKIRGISNSRCKHGRSRPGLRLMALFFVEVQEGMEGRGYAN